MQDDNGLSAIHLAAQYGQLGVIQTILEIKPTVDPTPERWRQRQGEEIDPYTWITPLFLAIQNGHIEVQYRKIER